MGILIFDNIYIKQYNMPDFNEIRVFGKKTVADVFKEIYESTKKKEKIISSTIEDIKSYIKNIGDAVQLGPMLASYMDVWVKSDEHMIKMVAIVTRATQRAEEGGDTTITEEEKNQLMALADQINNPQAQA